MSTIAIVGTVVGALVGALTISVFLYQAVRQFFKLVRGVLRFLDDWFGEAARPGFVGRPGFPERISALEERFGAFEVDLGEVKKQLHPNSGTTLRDTVDRVEKTLKDKA